MRARRGALRPAQREASGLAPSSRRLPRDQLALALDAPAIAGEVAVRPHHAMAGDRDRERIGAAGLGDRAHRFRLADRAGDLRVGRRLAGRYGAAAPPTPAAGTRCRGCRAADPGADRALRPGRRLRRPCARIRRRRPEAPRAESGPAGRARALRGSSPSRIAHTPLFVAATSTAPSEASPDREANDRPCPAAPERARGHAEPAAALS